MKFGFARRGDLLLQKDVWDLPKGHRIEVEFNKFGQAVGKGHTILSEFRGSIACNGNLCPLHYLDWRDFIDEELEAIINPVKARFTIPNSALVESFILQSIDQKWKDYKCRLKKKYFIPERLYFAAIIGKVPENVNDHQWKDLVLYWNTDASTIASQVGTKARRNVHILHTSGSISFAERGHRFRQKHNRSQSRMEVFDNQHRCATWSFVNETTQQIIAEASSLTVERSRPDIDDSERIALENEVYNEVVGLDKYGHPRGYGMRVTANVIRGVCRDGTSIMRRWSGITEPRFKSRQRHLSVHE